MSALDYARDVYRLLVHNYPQGLKRTQLAAKLKLSDRATRAAVNKCRAPAALHPDTSGRVWVVGFDPETERYVAAQDAAQARRVITYQESRVRDMIQTLEAQKDAFKTTYGVTYQENTQEGLF